MKKASKVIPQGNGLAKSLVARARTVVLPWQLRCGPEFVATDSAGDEIAVSLADAMPLRGGDVLVAEDGALIQVVAAQQALVRVSSSDADGGALELARAAYQMAKRDIAVSFEADHLLVEPSIDTQLLLRQMRLSVEECESTFEPVGVLPLHKYVVVAPQSLMSMIPPGLRRQRVDGPAVAVCGDGHCGHVH